MSKKKPYYTICPYCNAHLDPGEKCNCGEINTLKKDKDSNLYKQNHFGYTGHIYVNEFELSKTLGKDR